MWRVYFLSSGSAAWTLALAFVCAFFAQVAEQLQYMLACRSCILAFEALSDFPFHAGKADQSMHFTGERP